MANELDELSKRIKESQTTKANSSSTTLSDLDAMVANLNNDIINQVGRTTKVGKYQATVANDLKTSTASNSLEDLLSSIQASRKEVAEPKAVVATESIDFEIEDLISAKADEPMFVEVTEPTLVAKPVKKAPVKKKTPAKKKTKTKKKAPAKKKVAAPVQEVRIVERIIEKNNDEQTAQIKNLTLELQKATAKTESIIASLSTAGNTSERKIVRLSDLKGHKNSMFVPVLLSFLFGAAAMYAVVLFLY